MERTQTSSGESAAGARTRLFTAWVRRLPVEIYVFAALSGAWLWLYRAVFAHLKIIFSRQEFRTNQILLVGVVVLLVYQGHQAWQRGERPDWRSLNLAPRLFWPGLALALGGSVGYLVAERFLNVNTLSTSLFALATYGLIGLWLPLRRWREGVPALLLLVGVLPFGEHMQTFIGYPMRILTAQLVGAGLQAAGAHPVGVDTILIFENGISQVDLPCSGVQSLWTGALFLIAATWIERRPVNLRWLLVGLVFAGLLFCANLARIGILVTVGQVAGWRDLAEMLHVPLGVLGFAGACAAAAGLLSRQPPADSGETFMEPAAIHPPWLGPGLVGLAFLMALAYTPRPPDRPAQPATGWQFPASLGAEAAPLDPRAREALAQGGADAVERLRFNWHGITGSLILIPSHTWRAHHRPERCFEVYGLKVENGWTHLVSTDFPVRFVTLGVGDYSNQFSATYWFQSQSRTTDDYATRVWADLAPQRQEWVLVNLLFDSPQDPSAVELQALYLEIHAMIERNLRGGL